MNYKKCDLFISRQHKRVINVFRGQLDLDLSDHLWVLDCNNPHKEFLKDHVPPTRLLLVWKHKQIEQQKAFCLKHDFSFQLRTGRRDNTF